jgi:hypothetical protein
MMMKEHAEELMGLRVAFKSNGVLYIPNVKKFNVTDGFLWVECDGTNKGLMALYNIDEIFNVVVFKKSADLVSEMEREEQESQESKNNKVFKQEKE